MHLVVLGGTDPGELWTDATPNGLSYALVSSAGDPYLRGDGLTADFRPRPFVDRLSLADTTRARLFQGATREEVPRIVRELVAAGEPVYGVRVLTTTLEETYLEAVGGETS